MQSARQTSTTKQLVTREQHAGAHVHRSIRHSLQYVQVQNRMPVVDPKQTSALLNNSPSSARACTCDNMLSRIYYVALSTPQSCWRRTPACDTPATHADQLNRSCECDLRSALATLYGTAHDSRTRVILPEDTRFLQWPFLKS